MKLKEWLKNNDISAKKFADTIGVSANSVHRFMNGDLPSKSNLAKIIHATSGQVSLVDFEVCIQQAF